MGTGLLIALIVGVFFGRGLAARLAHRVAARHLEAVAIGPAERSLDWAESVDPGNPQTSLLRAAALRRLTDYEAWQSCVKAAEAAGASPAALELEDALGKLRWGADSSATPETYEKLIAQGASPRDAIHAVIHGLMARRQTEAAFGLIDAWASTGGDEAEAAFLRGGCWWASGEREEAQSEFEKALAARPADEVSRLNLLMLLEEQHEYSKALQLAEPLLAATPHRESVRVQVSRLLRKRGQLEAARQLLPTPPEGSEPSVEVMLELGAIEYESGNYEVADRWFMQAKTGMEHGSEAMRTAATVYAYAGKPEQAKAMFLRLEEILSRQRQTSELERRLQLNPNDTVAAEQLRSLAQRPALDARASSAEVASNDDVPLFARHCAACHGDRGAGDGRAARHLFPRPRNFRKDSFRLISTRDRMPTLTDIERVIHNGMPGTSMPPFPALTPDERTQLAREVLAMYCSRFDEGGPNHGSEESSGADENVLPVPEIGPATPESIERGRVAFLASGCQQCHTIDTAAEPPPLLLDDEGLPTVARDLVRDPLKGGADGAALFRRIRLGMPGTPHPASPSLSDDETIALVHYCQSLGTEPKRQLTNHERSLQALRPRRETPP